MEPAFGVLWPPLAAMFTSPVCQMFDEEAYIGPISGEHGTNEAVGEREVRLGEAAKGIEGVIWREGLNELK